MSNTSQSLIKIHKDESGYAYLSYLDANDITEGVSKYETELITINPCDLKAMGELLIKASEQYSQQQEAK